MHASIHLGLIISHFSNYEATHRLYHYLTKWEHLCPGLSWNLKITLLLSHIRYHGAVNVNLHIYLNAIWTKIFKIKNRTKSISKYFTIFNNICINSRILYNTNIIYKYLSSNLIVKEKKKNFNFYFFSIPPFFLINLTFPNPILFL